MTLPDITYILGNLTVMSIERASKKSFWILYTVCGMCVLKFQCGEIIPTTSARLFLDFEVSACAEPLFALAICSFKCSEVRDTAPT